MLRVLFVLLVSSTAIAGPVRTVHSGRDRTHLLALFTSEGCSSCPPMDAWLAAHRATFHDARVIPIALHVDYWNEIGWVDPFSSAHWTALQRRVAIASRGELYTPELALDGREIRIDALEAKLVNRVSPSIALSVRDEGTALSVRARVEGAPADAHVYFAVAEDGLVVDVLRGENAGRRLTHEAVLRELDGPLPLDESERRVAIRPTWRKDRLTIVAFIEAVSSTEVLQAVALPLQ